jgi:hypothetical protein
LRARCRPPVPKRSQCLYVAESLSFGRGSVAAERRGGNGHGGTAGSGGSTSATVCGGPKCDTSQSSNPARDRSYGRAGRELRSIYMRIGGDIPPEARVDENSTTGRTSPNLRTETGGIHPQGGLAPTRSPISSNPTSSVYSGKTGREFQASAFITIPAVRTIGDPRFQAIASTQS